MMLVKLLMSFEWKGVQLEDGTVLSLPDREAKELIRRKIAIPFREKPTAEVVRPEEIR